MASAMAKAMHLDAAGFEKALGKSGVLVADFWAGWCMPCKMLAPSIDKLAEEYDGRATVGKVDFDEEQALAARYGAEHPHRYRVQERPDSGHIGGRAPL